MRSVVFIFRAPNQDVIWTRERSINCVTNRFIREWKATYWSWISQGIII